MLRKTVPDLYSGDWLKLGRRRLRVGYGEKTVHETKQNADVFEAPTRLFSTSLSNLVHCYVTVHPSARASVTSWYHVKMTNAYRITWLSPLVALGL